MNKATPSGCWEWTGALNTHGYGNFKVDGRPVPAHRYSWIIQIGSIPDGMLLDHRCANRKCVNPKHLRTVTPLQNQQHRAGLSMNNATGSRGVSWHENRKSWGARVQFNGRSYFGGYHSTIEAADAAAKDLRVELYTHDDHEEWIEIKEKQ